jgi:hypothetical protein
MEVMPYLGVFFLSPAGSALQSLLIASGVEHVDDLHG